MDTQSIKDFCEANNITAISNVRSNVNGYKYVTMLDNNKTSENYYFSKNSSNDVNVNDSPATWAKDSVVVNTTNADGQPRTKISTNSNYTDVTDLF